MRIPTMTPIAKLPKNTSRKIPMASKRLKILRVPTSAPGLPLGTYFCAVWNSTMAIASFSIDSPKIIVYNFGSTLYALKMARIVTGSVADNVAPIENASMNEILNP